VKLPLLCRVLPACAGQFPSSPLRSAVPTSGAGLQVAPRTASHAFEECQLIVEVVIGAVEPEPRADRAVNSQRSADGIAEVAILQFVMFREYLDSLGRPRSFYRDTELLQPSRRSTAGTVGPGAAALRRSTGARRAGSVPVPPHLLLLQFPLQLTQVFERVLVVAVHGNPLASLRRRIHRIHAERQITFQMSPDRRRRQTGRSPFLPALGRK
jgi:hypothetical protein